MKEIIISTQKQLDELKEVKAGENVTITAALRLPGILYVRGCLVIQKPLDGDWNENRFVRASGTATVRAWGSATVKASGPATVRLLGFSIGIGLPLFKFKIESDFAKVVIREQVFKVKKKTIVYKKLRDDRIATLELKRGQEFQSENQSKCRTGSAKVLKIEGPDGKNYKTGKSMHEVNFMYKVGETVSAPYDPEIKECSTGIHFFLDRDSAERYA